MAPKETTHFGWLRRIRILLPVGGSLPELVWIRRHRFLVRLTWAHALAIGLAGIVLGYRWDFTFAALFGGGTVLHTLWEGLIVGGCAGLAGCKRLGRSARATFVGFGLMTSSAIFVHLSGGYIEVHFHFFVMLVFLALYQDWIPFGLAILYVAAHHGIVGVLWPASVYNHAAAINAPWTWAGIHAFFVLWASAGSAIAWRFNETAFAWTQRILRSTHDGIFGLDAEGKVTFFNPSAAKILGLSDRPIIGESMREILRHTEAGKDRQERCPILLPLADGSPRLTSDELFWRQDGTCVVVDYVSAPIVEHGKITGAVVNLRDITERKRAEQVQKLVKEIGQDVTSLDIDSLLRKVTEKVREFFKVDVSDVRILEKGMWKLVGISGIEPDRMQSRRTGESRGRAGWIVHNKATLVVRDIFEEKHIPSGETLKHLGIRAYMGVPLLSRNNEVMGVLRALSYQPREFTRDDVELLEQIAIGTTIALEDARLFETTRLSLHRLTTLREIDEAVSATLDLRALLNILPEKLSSAISYSVAVSISLRNRETGALELISGLNIGGADRQRATVTPARDRAREISETKRPLVVRDVQTDPLSWDPQWVRDSGLVSYLGMPLIAKGEALGILGIYTKEQHNFSEEEIEFYTMVAGRAAIAIHNSQLYEQLSAMNRRLEKSLGDLSGLYTALTPLAPAESLQEVMEGVIDRLIASTGSHAALIRVPDAARGGFVIAQRKFPEEYLRAVEVTKPGSAVDMVFNSGEPVISPDIGADPRLKGKFQLKVGLRSCAILPLKVRGETRGVMHLASGELGYFKEDQRDHLMAVARQMGITLENRELFDEATVSKDRLEKAYQTLAQQAQELMRSNSDLQQFAYVASHDLQEPLRVITGFTQLLAKRYQGKLDKDADEYIGHSVEGAMRMQRLINDLLLYSRVGTQGKPFAHASCEEVLATALANLRVVMEESEAVVTHEPLPEVWCDGEQLVQLLQNLIGNGIKYRNSDRPRVHVSCRREGSQWLFSVKDNGIGIDSQYAERVFVIFQRLHGRDEYPGSGIGLAICKKIAEHHGGNIWVESELGKGATFYFTMPARA